MATYPAIPGFYVAHHRWLDAEEGPGRVHKVGMTGDLQVRLCDDAYTTCFPEGWKYHATIETQAREHAELVETAVLRRAEPYRIDGRELVRATGDVLLATAVEEAARLLPEGSWRVNASPAYVMRRREGLGQKLVKPEPPAVTVQEPAAAEEPISRGPAATPPGGEPSAIPLREGGPSEIEDLVAEALGDPSLKVNEFCEQPIEDRVYQTEATQRCLAEVERTGRAILQMACRCGKTRVAHNVIKTWLGSSRTGHILYLVPGLSLLRQTAQKLSAYFEADGLPLPAYLLVGSDARPIPLTRGTSASMTTDPEEIRRALAPDSPRRLVVCTYQSSPLLPPTFTHQVFDEAHRTAGTNDPSRPFASVLLGHRGERTPRRLFITATPANEPKPVSMKNSDLYGGVAFRYHLRQGIQAGYVNPYRLVFVGDNELPGTAVAGSKKTATDGDASPAHVLRASAECPKLLVFCRDIAHAETLQGQVEEIVSTGGWPDVWGLPPKCYSAHSRMPSTLVAATTRAFAAEDLGASQLLFSTEEGHTPPSRHILFNCRLFQEGVELPALNGVLFAAPRHAPRDIIQSICRPLNRKDGLGRDKPPSAVYLPVRRDPTHPPDAPTNLARFATIVPFADALAEEDPAFYEYLLDPAANKDSLVEWAELSAGTHHASDYLKAIRRVVRYGASGKTDRLLRTAKIPWKVAFPRMKEIVHGLRRYIKTTDKLAAGEIQIPFHRWYKWVVAEYVKFGEGAPSALSPAQVADLEELPEWKTRGVEGPYPWRESLDFLDGYLAANGGVPPPVEINKGGFVGLDATPMERLSGTLTCVNQSDGKRGKKVTLPEWKQTELDELCCKWGLRWRKVRMEDGSLPIDARGKYTGPPSFIQEAYEAFKKIYAAQKTAGVPSEYIEEHFPGYPLKHAKQEIIGFDKALRPARWRGNKGSRPKPPPKEPLEPSPL
jgi:superfamily II DNA or RNA helicase